METTMGVSRVFRVAGTQFRLSWSTWHEQPRTHNDGQGSRQAVILVIALALAYCAAHLAWQYRHGMIRDAPLAGGNDG
jgi:hypothetical protein